MVRLSRILRQPFFLIIYNSVWTRLPLWSSSHVSYSANSLSRNSFATPADTLMGTVMPGVHYSPIPVSTQHITLFFCLLLQKIFRAVRGSARQYWTTGQWLTPLLVQIINVLGYFSAKNIGKSGKYCFFMQLRRIFLTKIRFTQAVICGVFETCFPWAGIPILRLIDSFIDRFWCNSIL